MNVSVTQRTLQPLSYLDLKQIFKKQFRDTSNCAAHSPGGPRHDVVDVRPLEAVEGGRGGHSVGAHVLKDQPVTHLQVGQVALLDDAVEAVARWTPDTARVHDLIWLWLLLAAGGVVWLRRFVQSRRY